MQQGFIVTATTKELKSLSLWALKGNWQKAVIASALSVLVISVPEIILSQVMGSAKWVNVSDVYSMLVQAPIQLGLTMFYLNIFRKKEAKPLDIFFGFEFIFKAALLNLITAALVFIQLCLFVVPGIIAAYRYAMAVYILADDPRKSALQCIRESKMMMVGNKMHLFGLTLSFFGWLLLSMVPMLLVQQFFPVDNFLLYSAMIVLTSLFQCLAEPYMIVACCAFYEIANGSLRVKRSGGEYSGANQSGFGNAQDFGNAQNFNSVPDFDTTQNMGNNVQDVEWKNVEAESEIENDPQ